MPRPSAEEFFRPAPRSGPPFVSLAQPRSLIGSSEQVSIEANDVFPVDRYFVTATAPPGRADRLPHSDGIGGLGGGDMEVVLALAAAVAYGLSDFAGGVLTKRAHVFTVILLSQLVTCTILLLALPFWAGSFSWRAVAWGTGAGVAAVLGASLLYRGLAIGRMGVVAPITAVLGGAIPLSFGFAVGEHPDPVALVGVAVGLVAITLISTAPDPATGDGGESRLADVGRGETGIAEAFGAGLGFGLFFILLERAPDESGLWPLVGTRIALVASIAMLAAFSGASFRPAAGMRRSLVGLGVVNLAADLLYLLATRAGLLSIVAVITSLYPAATVALARIFLKERIVRQQLLGMFCAAVSVTLIAVR